MATLNVEKAKEYCREHFNELGVYGGLWLSRLIGYREDPDDCYYLLRFSPDGWTDECREAYCSMVGGWFTIKPMGETEYDYTDRNSGIPKADEYKETVIE